MKSWQSVLQYHKFLKVNLSMAEAVVKASTRAKVVKVPAEVEANPTVKDLVVLAREKVVLDSRKVDTSNHKWEKEEKKKY